MVVKGRNFTYQKNVDPTGLTCLYKTDLGTPRVIPAVGWYVVWKRYPPPQNNPTKPCPVSNRTRTNDLSQMHAFLMPPFFNDIQAKTEENNIAVNSAENKTI